MPRFARAGSFLALAVLWTTALSGTGASASAQVWDNTGNSKLSGAYFFREVFYVVGDQYGDIGRAVALYGSINFSGTGTYTLAGTVADSSSGTRGYSQTGTYTVAASGYGFISNPYSPGDYIYGLVSNGVFIGSSTDNAVGFNDLFVAAAASGANNATFQGSYTLAYMSFPFNSFGFADPTDSYDALATLNPNGSGTIGSMSVTAYAASTGNSPYNRNESNVRYTFSNGAGSMVIPAPANPPSGIPSSQIFFISPDGNLIFGGSPGFWDMFIGVRSGSGVADGLYYQAGLGENAAQIASLGVLSTYYGSMVAVNDGTIVAHQRIFEPIFSGSFDYTYSDSFPAGSPGGYTDTGTSTQYVISSDGGVRVGFGIGPLLGIHVAIRGPKLSGPGVFLDPTGVQNSGSFAPFTAGIARGEVIVLNGTGLADQFVLADDRKPFPTTLGGVQVLMNNIPAALYYVSPGQIAVVVPYGITVAVAQIQVVNNGTMSNAITAFVGTTAPGVFVANGIGIAQHTDYSLVTPSNPAHAGEALLIYVTGLGDVFPTIADGGLGPVPVSNTTNTFTAAIGGVSATVLVTELVPTVAGKYVLALTVPDGVPAGNAVLSIAGSDSTTSSTVLPIAAP